MCYLNVLNVREKGLIQFDHREGCELQCVLYSSLFCVEAVPIFLPYTVDEVICHGKME